MRPLMRKGRSHRLEAMVAGLLLAITWPMPACGEEPARINDTESEKARLERIQWWRDGRFGMFIHWGLYAIPAGEWKGSIHKRGYSEWIMFEEKIPAKEYAGLARQFNPTKFDADAWVAVAKAAGMKYLVITAKHHDGFSLYDSKLTDYDTIDATPFKRDAVGELAEACKRAGIKFGCYYSDDRDWYRPTGPGNRYKQSNTWDYPNSPKEDFDKYFEEFAKPQVEELLTRYKPDLLWFDGIGMKTPEQTKSLYQSIRRLSPSCVINSRIDTCVPPKQFPPPLCDYYSSGDNEILKNASSFEWENPGSMNTSFGFNKFDENWVEPDEIIRRLVDTAGKNGNYLLNVGPTAEGVIPAACVERLAEVGKWMNVNSEAVQGTMPLVVEGKDASQDVRLMTNGTTVYAACLKWPGKEWTVGKMPGKGIRSVRLLGSDLKVDWKLDKNVLKITSPKNAPGPHAWVYRIDIQKD